ncbi:MAG: hypothetical protein MR601_04295 [Erysipelotrichaceae bacterium]|nr:hypothetical protein [Erysipelotrichaceae bacterium]
MLLVIATIVLAGFVLYMKIKEYKELKNIYSEILENKKFEKLDLQKNSYIIALILIIFGIISIVFGIILKEVSTATMGLLIILLILSEVMTSKFKNVYYYNDSNFVVNGKILRYKSIKKIDIGKFPFRQSNITTLSNENYVVAKKFALFLKDKINKK